METLGSARVLCEVFLNRLQTTKTVASARLRSVVCWTCYLVFFFALSKGRQKTTAEVGHAPSDLKVLLAFVRGFRSLSRAFSSLSLAFISFH